ncbi:MAG: hypothetical protein GY832_31660 [Chloroflexi bacterium]|nr:hypothetical protein [Chloroflexota bacterium]
MTFNLTEEELATADLAAETAELTNSEKVDWANVFTHKAANRQGKLKRAYDIATLPYLGQDIPVPQSARNAWRVEFAALGRLIITAQTAVVDIVG